MTDPLHGGRMAGKTVLVTGGIGRATALGLAAMGAHLAITGRDRDRTEDAAREIRAGGGRVDVFVADLSAQSEVRRLADEVLTSLPRIDVLVNNVGGYWNTRHLTDDGLERTFALNHLAPFLLLTCSSTDSRRHHQPEWSSSPPTPRPLVASTSTTSKAPRPTPGLVRTTNPSSATSSSPVSWPEDFRAPQ